MPRAHRPPEAGMGLREPPALTDWPGDACQGRSARLLVEEGEGDRREQRGLVQVVVGEAGQDGERVPALGPALPHPAAVAEAAVEQLEDLDVMAPRGAGRGCGGDTGGGP